ncbi:RHS repeat domain-containing protein [Xanthomonas euvesicatoria]|uniref:RHS repeat domain-containing protein n=1 Tax=Xanthomonas euvesicatoria TaxID=456327 RepID=UPI003A0FE274
MSPWMKMGRLSARLRDCVRAAALGLLLVSASAVAQTTVEYIHTDALGSPVAVTNASGQVVERSFYEPYGAQVDGAPDDGPGFTGHVEDAATGLIYMQQRYYDPAIPRFLSVDPVAANLNTGSNFCRYCYVENNPYTFVDPDGRAKAVVWLLKLTGNGMQKISRITKEQAVIARRQGENVLSNRRQISSQIETAAHGRDEQLRHAAHKLDDGSRGLPHYQTDGKFGHSFWGKLSVAAAVSTPRKIDPSITRGLRAH